MKDQKPKLKKRGRMLTVMFTVTALSLTSVGVLALEANPALPENQEIRDVIQTPRFGSFTGKVTEIQPLTDTDGKAQEGWYTVVVEKEDGALAHFRITPEAFALTDEPLAVGAEFTGYYDATLPMIMIYPPQYTPPVYAVDLEDPLNVSVDHFDKNLISSDNMLKLNLSDTTAVVTQSGETYKGELTDKNLAVVYDFITKSLPAQTTPITVVVLDAQDEPVPSGEETDGGVTAYPVKITVNGAFIDAPEPYFNEEQMVMVPLRAVAEALGHQVSWDNSLKKATLNNGIAVTLFKDSYVNDKGETVKLGNAPETKNGSTYVPITFFREIIKMNNAYFFEGQVDIDNGEKMN